MNCPKAGTDLLIKLSPDASVVSIVPSFIDLYRVGRQLIISRSVCKAKSEHSITKMSLTKVHFSHCTITNLYSRHTPITSQQKGGKVKGGYRIKG